MANSSKTNAKIREYYNATYFDYLVGIKLRKHNGIHYGYWDESVRNNSQAVANLNKVLAKKLDIRPGMKILDAGCGVGGSTIWLANKYDVQVTGITLVSHQANKAIQKAKKLGLEDSTNFLVQDYLETDFDNSVFDIVWGLESVCYAEDKLDFLKEAFRILKPGGQLVVADGFAFKKSYSEKENESMRIWLDGWAVSSLANFNAFKEDLAKSGFKSITAEDATNNVLRFSKWLHDRAKLSLPVDRLFKLLRIRSKIESSNVDAAIWQYRCVREGLCGYGIFTATKPSDNSS